MHSFVDLSTLRSIVPNALPPHSYYLLWILMNVYTSPNLHLSGSVCQMAP